MTMIKETRIEVWGLLSLNRKQIMLFELVALSVFICLTVFLFTYDFKEHEDNAFYTFHAKYAKYFSLLCTFLIIIEAQYFWAKFTEAQLLFIAEQHEKILQQNSELFAQKEEILLQKKKIEAQNIDIKDSMNYASRIQSILLPSERKIERLFFDYFLLFKPKDIVSGDFYWAETHQNYSIIALADCTGHGVPGAFVSIMGISFLNEIFLSAKGNNEKIEPSLFLNKLKHKFVHSFENTESDQEFFDGIDISLCMIDTRERTIYYSGALLSSFLVRKNAAESDKLVLLKPDMHPIGLKSMGEHTFKTNQINYEHGDMLYMLTDGYADQFGGNEGRKFLTNNLKSLLSTIAAKPLDKQKNKLEDVFENWKGANPQVDDTTILGIRL
jgi:serine phosphatase RsbU (regulator of sigma subunit)